MTRPTAVDSAIANRLAELADGSNYGTLEDLQEALLNWSMDLHSGTESLQDWEITNE